MSMTLKNRTMGPWLIWDGFHVKSAGFHVVLSFYQLHEICWISLSA